MNFNPLISVSANGERISGAKKRKVSATSHAVMQPRPQPSAVTTTEARLKKAKKSRGNCLTSAMKWSFFAAASAFFVPDTGKYFTFGFFSRLFFRGKKSSVCCFWKAIMKSADSATDQTSALGLKELLPPSLLTSSKFAYYTYYSQKKSNFPHVFIANFCRLRPWQISPPIRRSMIFFCVALPQILPHISHSDIFCHNTGRKEATH